MSKEMKVADRYATTTFVRVGNGWIVTSDNWGDGKEKMHVYADGDKGSLESLLLAVQSELVLDDGHFMIEQPTTTAEAP